MIQVLLGIKYAEKNETSQSLRRQIIKNMQSCWQNTHICFASVIKMPALMKDEVG